MSEKVWLVWYSRGRLKVLCGAFSTDEKATKYIEGVPEHARCWWYSQPVEIDFWA